jgi:periplasmic protein TonB
MSGGVMSGTLVRPAAGFSLPSAALGSGNARRLTGAALAVVGLHVALLTFRPGAAPANFVAPSTSPVMAVRVLRSPPATLAATNVSPAAPTGSALAPAVPTPTSTPGEPSHAPAMSRALPERARAQPPAAPTTPTAAAPSGRATPTEGDLLPAAAVATNAAAGADAPLAAAPDYAFGVRLDPGPRPLSDIEPDYPDMLHLREGVVVLRLLISERGMVDNVAVVRAEPRGIFEQAAIEAFSKARFSPGLAAGTPVKSQITVEVQFMPINRGARVSGKTY